MGQQVAFILLIVLCGMILFQIFILAKNQKERYENIMKELEQIKSKN